MIKHRGFTLIEVLLALIIISIAFTALLKANSENIRLTYRLEEKSIAHWVGLQGIAMIQLGLLTPHAQEELTQKTVMLHQTWYWRVKLTPTPVPNMQQISIKLSHRPEGPFQHEVIGFKYE